MKKLLITLAALGSLAALSSLALPAFAESESGGGACAAIPAGNLPDVNSLPAAPIVGHQSIKGMVGDECDEGLGGGVAGIEGSEHGLSAEAGGEHDD